jgi:hypothetical protein
MAQRRNAMAQSRASFASMKFEVADEMLKEEFWENGGVGIIDEVYQRVGKRSRAVRVSMFHVVRGETANSRWSDSGKFHDVKTTVLGKYSEKSKIGKKLFVHVNDDAPARFLHYTALGIIPKALTLVLFFEHYFEKDGECWVEIE